MTNPDSIFLWEGKVQLGDEPGIYGNASFSGLSIKYPFTIFNMDPKNPQDDTLKLEILTSAVNVYKGYPGHKIVIYKYLPDSPTSFHWYEQIVKDTDKILDQATSTTVEIPVFAHPGNTYLSLAIEIDHSVTPGLYDDFLLLGINYLAVAKLIYAKFGFQ